MTYSAAPADPASATLLAGVGLDLRVLADGDADAFAAWIQAVRRGFLDADGSADELETRRELLAYRRKSGVYDPTVPAPGTPVATLASWIGELSVPGGRDIPSCAISSVTVAPTHRRRGIARALVEGELRLAASQGVPAAVLTVSESVLYGRYGFGPAASVASLTLDTKAATWTGPKPEGRVDFITRERLRDLLPALHDRVRLSWPGELRLPGGHPERVAGINPAAKDAAARRAVQYTDATGAVAGLAVYTAHENHEDFARSTVRIGYLLAETPDAYAALWRYFVELDLIGTVEANELSVDEPLLWMISDQRAARVRIIDHHYLRLLDIPAALEARSYGAAGTLALDVTDPIGISAGRWLLQVDAAGVGHVRPWDGAPPSGAVEVRLGVTELSAAYLGGVSLATLAAAGRVQTSDPAAAARVLAWHVPPRQSFWY